MNLRKKSLLSVAAFTLAGLNTSAAPRIDYNVTQKDRENLPVADKIPVKSDIKDARDVKEAPPMYQSIQPPKDAPNVVLIMLDDVGYSASSAMGGPVNTPTFEALAKEGLLYTQFHTTALSASTRVSLLTGRSHHRNNMGAVGEIATSSPGNTGVKPNTNATIAQILRMNGYPTAMYGKTHEVPAWMTGANGSRELWPTNIGFEEFYGFVGGEADQYEPTLVHGTNTIPTPRDENYNLTTDLADKAISWINVHKSMQPNKPFFVYFAPGATHAPHQPPEEWRDAYKGKFDKGWDVLREETHKKQMELGIIPKGTPMPPKPSFVQDWDKLSPTQKKVYARGMEVYAGYLEYADRQVGRLIDNLKATGQYDNTIFIYSMGDNGASGEGGLNGSVNEMRFFNSMPESLEEMEKAYDRIGTKESESNYALGWAVALDTPFAFTKMIAGDLGGTANGLAISWKNGIKAKGEKRNQWAQAYDITPTLLDVIGLPVPKTVNGVPQQPMDGVSLKSTFEPNPKDISREVYYEILGSRAFYKDGWYARAIHLYPTNVILSSLDKDVWELYDTKKDPALANDLAKQMPEKLKELQLGFDKAAKDNLVYPMDDRTLVRMLPGVARRPTAVEDGMTSVTLYPTDGTFPEPSFLNMKNKDNEIIATVDVKNPAKTNGVLISQGGFPAGWSFYVENGIPKYTYNFLRLKQTTIVSKAMLKKGRNEIKYVFKYNENNKFPKGVAGTYLGKGGNMYLYLNGELVAKGSLENTVPNNFAGTNGVWIGKNDGTPVVDSYKDKMPFKFNGTLDNIKVSAKLDPEEAKRVQEFMKDMANKKATEEKQAETAVKD